MNCPDCGAPLKGGETFCNNCGLPLGAKEKVFTAVRENKYTKPLKVYDYLLLLIAHGLPGINLLVSIFFLCKRGANLNRKRFALASLILNILLYAALSVLYFCFRQETRNLLQTVLA